MSDAHPYLAAALMCERVLEEKDQVLSIIRVVDIFYVQPFPRDLPKEAQAVAPFVAVLCFKKSFAETSPVKHTVSLVLHGPSGTPIRLRDKQKKLSSRRLFLKPRKRPPTSWSTRCFRQTKLNSVLTGIK